MPTGGLIMDGSGNLYGTMPYGGASGAGTVFELKAGSNTITTLAAFNGTNGEYPEPGLIMDASGNLYGTTQYGGIGWSGSDFSGSGTVFEIKAGSNTITTLAAFNGTNGESPPYGGLTMDGIGNLYGTTEYGGANGCGTVFEITAASIAAGSPTITTLASFNGNNGSTPEAGLIMDGGGNLYGTAHYGGIGYTGGETGYGTMFEIKAGSNTITTLASFNGTNGGGPNSGLIMDGSGNLYGTAGWTAPMATARCSK